MLRHPLLLATLAFVVAAGGITAPAPADTVTVYSGRSKSFMDALFDRFEKESGHTVRRVYDGTAAVALKLQTEGDRSPADVVLAQDAGALGALSRAGLLAPLPDDLNDAVDARFVSDRGDWVATSLRARTLAYSTERVDADDLPQSVLDLTDPKYAGRVGFAPGNASFQAFVTALRVIHGEDAARQWLLDMKRNDVQSYPKNTAILEGIAAGEIDLGLPNHYYLLRYTEKDPGFPVAQTGFADRDIGNLVNVAGAAVLKTSRHPEAAGQLVAFLLSNTGQSWFTDQIHEYPVSGDAADAHADAPELNLNAIDDLEGTLTLLREVGLL